MRYRSLPGGWWHHRDLLGITEVVLASTDPGSLKRREERALARKQKADVSWLGVTAAQMLGSQLTINGHTLVFVAGFIGDCVKVWGSWPEMKDAIEANAQAMQSAGAKDVERLLREAIVLHLVNQAVTTYDAKQLYDWKRAVGLITDVSDSLGTTLPKGRNTPPVHQTEANCHVCGRFTLGRGHLFKFAKQAVARIVDQDVDAAELLHCLLDGRFCSCLVGNVQLDKRDVLA